MVIQPVVPKSCHLQGYMDLLPSDLDAKIQEQEQSLAAAQKVGDPFQPPLGVGFQSHGGTPKWMIYMVFKGKAWKILLTSY